MFIQTSFIGSQREIASSFMCLCTFLGFVIRLQKLNTFKLFGTFCCFSTQFKFCEIIVEGKERFFTDFSVFFIFFFFYWEKNWGKTSKFREKRSKWRHFYYRHKLLNPDLRCWNRWEKKRNERQRLCSWYFFPETPSRCSATAKKSISPGLFYTFYIAYICTCT